MQNILGFFFGAKMNACVVVLVPKKGFPDMFLLSILDTIELSGVILKKINRQMYQIKAIMLGYIEMSNGKILGEKYNLPVHRIAVLARRFLTKNE